MSTELLHKGILFDFDGTLVPNLDLADMRRICDADTRWLFLLACMLRRGLDGGGAADDSLHGYKYQNRLKRGQSNWPPALGRTPHRHV